VIAIEKGDRLLRVESRRSSKAAALCSGAPAVVHDVLQPGNICPIASVSYRGEILTGRVWSSS